MPNAHDIAIAAHEAAIDALETAFERPTKRAFEDAEMQSTTAQEETAEAEGDATDRPAGIEAAFALQETTNAADAHASRWSAGRRAAIRDAIAHHRAAIAAHQPHAQGE